MKKIVIVCIIFSLLASFAAAQNEIYNELGSNGFIVRLRKASDAKLGTGFGGFYDTIFANLAYQNVGAEIEYTVRFEDFDNLKKYTLENSTMDKAHVWVKPIQWMQILIGPKYCQALPGSFLVVYDDYTQNGMYGTQYFGMNILFDMVQGGFSVPTMVSDEGDFSMRFNFGINGTFDIGGSDLNIGAAYKMSNGSLGIFASYGSLYDKFYIGGGYTFNGENIFLTPRFTAGFQDVVGNRFGKGKDSIITLTGLYNGPISVGGDMEVAFAEEVDTLLYTGLLVAWDILDTLTLKFTGSYGGALLKSEKSRGAWSVDLYPQIIFNMGKHRLIGGVELNFYSSRRGINDDPQVTFAFALPISWRYTF